MRCPSEILLGSPKLDDMWCSKCFCALRLLLRGKIRSQKGQKRLVSLGVKINEGIVFMMGFFHYFSRVSPSSRKHLERQTSATYLCDLWIPNFCQPWQQKSSFSLSKTCCTNGKDGAYGNLLDILEIDAKRKVLKGLQVTDWLFNSVSSKARAIFSFCQPLDLHWTLHLKRFW